MLTLNVFGTFYLVSRPKATAIPGTAMPLHCYKPFSLEAKEKKKEKQPGWLSFISATCGDAA